MAQEESSIGGSSWIGADIFRLMFNIVKSSSFAVIVLFICYGAAAAALANISPGGFSEIYAALRAFFLTLLSMSAVSVFRALFESGKPDLKSIVPGMGFAGKVFLSVMLIALLFFAFSLFMGVVSAFAKYFFMDVFGRLFTRQSVYLFIALIIFIKISAAVFMSLCIIAFSGDNGFIESLSDSLNILSENKFLFFLCFSVLAALLTFLLSSDMTSLSKPGPAAVNKIASMQALRGTKFTAIFSAFMPLYWFFLTAVYFTLGHEGQTKKVMEDRQHFAIDYSGGFSSSGSESAAESVEEDSGFSLSNAFYFSWGIYKRLFLKLTAGVLGTYAVFLITGAAAFFILRRTGVIIPAASVKTLPAAELFFFAAGAFVFYYFLMFFFCSFALGFFRGKGTGFKNFFPGPAAFVRFILFLFFTAVFVISVPFTAEKINLLLRLAVKSYAFPFPVAAVVAAFFAFIIIYALISLFYAPFFIIDGHKFWNALADSCQIMKGRKMAFLCLLCVLFIINLIGHAFIVGWIFTIPFSALVLIQIYVTLSAGFGGYKEDAAQ